MLILSIRAIDGKITQKGFTLLEVLLTIGIFAVTLSIIATILSNHLVLFRDSQTASNHLQSVQLAINRAIYYIELNPSATLDDLFTHDEEDKVLVYNNGSIILAERIAGFDRFPSISGRFQLTNGLDMNSKDNSLKGFRIETDSSMEDSAGFLVILRKEKRNTKQID